MEGTAIPRNSIIGRILLRNIAERVSDKHTLPKPEWRDGAFLILRTASLTRKRSMAVQKTGAN